MNRTDVINKTAARIGAKTYLEIGVRNPADNFDKINIEFKRGVDPNAPSGREDIVRTSSNDFFKSLPKDSGKHDLIFIDGDHSYNQVKKDVDNAVKSLADGGAIVLHDANPLTADAAAAKKPSPSAVWNGEVWKVVIAFRKKKNYQTITVDCDHGCTIIKQAENPDVLKAPAPSKMSFEDLQANRKEWLNLIPVSLFEGLAAGTVEWDLEDSDTAEDSGTTK